MEDKLYYVYVIRCVDNSLYTGITTDVKRRFSEHTLRRSKNEKYTRSRPPVSVEAVWSCANRSDASKLEYAIKKLTKQNKEELINYPHTFDSIFGNTVNPDSYEYRKEFEGPLKE